MAVPPYTDFMLPMLEVLADGVDRSRKEIAVRVADKLAISAEDREITLPTSSMSLYRSRSGWALTYLNKAGLLDRVERGRYKLSSEGRAVLAERPPRVDDKFLLRYPSFAAFVRPERTATNQEKEPSTLSVRELDEPPKPLDPQEQLQTAFEIHIRSLAQELLDRISVMKPAAFERLVVLLLLKMGYGGFREDAGKAIGGPGDEGVDGVIKEDRLGLDLVYLQAKRWQNSVGRKEIQEFVGSLAGKHANKGVFITTSSFASTAIDYVRFLPNTKVVLIDGEELAKYCIEFGVGVQPITTYTVRRIDSDFFLNEEELDPS